jgi:transposase
VIQITPQMRILVAVEPVDFRNGIDGLSGICRRVLEEEPFSGTLFVFCNRRRTALKILSYDGQGFWLCQKRLSEGHYGWWPRGSQTAVSALAVHELQLLLWNGDLRSVRTAPSWRRIAAG